MAQGMKRLGTPIAALFGLALAAMIVSSWLINRDALRQAVEAQIRAVTGLDLTVNGSIDVSVFPGSYVSFHDVGLKGGTEDQALRVDVLTANLRLLPMLLQIGFHRTPFESGMLTFAAALGAMGMKTTAARILRQWGETVGLPPI